MIHCYLCGLCEILLFCFVFFFFLCETFVRQTLLKGVICVRNNFGKEGR